MSHQPTKPCAKAQLSALLDAVESGDEVVLTRRGQPVAEASGCRAQGCHLGAIVPALPCPRPPAKPTIAKVRIPYWGV
jgi:antitoxin (DNA-binding transcriptional repressor) of toxin-antitoxin stability system